MAKILALAPDDTHWTLEARRTDAIPNTFFIPTDLKTWHRFYYRSRVFRYAILFFMCNGDKKVAERIAHPFELAMREERIPRDIRLERWNHSTPEQRKFATHCGYNMWHNAEEELDRLLATAANDTKPLAPPASKILRSPQLHFFFRVYAPCFSLYKMPPSKLLLRAAAGDIKAADQLLRLDPSASSHPRIAPLLHQLDQIGQIYTRAKLTEAQASSPYRPLKLWSLKASYGGFLLGFAKRLGCRLNSGDIRRFYDAVASDLKHETHDRTLPRNEDAFRKGLQKQRSKWNAELDGNEDSQISSQ